MTVFPNLLIAVGVLFITTIAVGITVREDGEPLSEVTLAGALYAALLVPVVLPGVVL